MVTTRQQLMEYIVGNMTSVIPPHTLTALEWEDILLTAAKELTLEYLRGFMSVPQILETGHNVYSKHTRPPINLRIYYEASQLQEADIRESDVWLPCVALGTLPNVAEWPRSGKGYRVATKPLLLMKRHKRSSPNDRPQFEFFKLSLDVRLMDTANRTIWDPEHWLKLIKAELVPVELRTVLEDAGKDLYGVCTILLTQLMNAQTLTFDDLTGRYNQAKKAKERLEALRARVGVI